MQFVGAAPDAGARLMRHVGLDVCDRSRAPGSPPGIVSHYAGPSPHGWCVVDVWESLAHACDYLATRFGPAMTSLGDLPEPVVVSFDVE
jgi:hypothetical protein